jgi:hypothetical protein
MGRSSNSEHALGISAENNNYNYISLDFGSSIVIEIGFEMIDYEPAILETVLSNLGEHLRNLF